MKQRVREALGRAGLHGRVLLVAVSGGVDSMVLLHVLTALAPELGVSLRVGHVHHGLRVDADRDATLAREATGRLGLGYHEVRVDPRAERDGAASSRSRPTLQESSRRLRYRALGEMARDTGACAVATAHNRDDQVETVLLRVLRGTGPDGLAGMRERAPWPGASAGEPALSLLRPLLEVSRAEILEFAVSQGVLWREDESNRDPHYARNRLREHWLPQLRDAFNPRLDRAVMEMARAVREEREWLAGIEETEAAARFERLPDGSLRIDVKDWERLPAALARRLARRALIAMGAGRDVSARHLERMLAFFRQGRRGARLELPGALRLQKDSPGFRLSRAPVPPIREC